MLGLEPEQAQRRIGTRWLAGIHAAVFCIEKSDAQRLRVRNRHIADIAPARLRTRCDQRRRERRREGEKVSPNLLHAR
jgi:hypothetical protein